MFGGLCDVSEAEAAFRREGMTSMPQQYEVAHCLVEGRKAVTAAFSKGWSISAMAQAGGIKERYDTIKRIEICLQEAGHPMGYSTDRDAPSKIAVRRVLCGADDTHRDQEGGR